MIFSHLSISVHQTLPCIALAGGGRKLAPSSGGVFEPHTIHMPYLHSTCFQSRHTSTSCVVQNIWCLEQSCALDTEQIHGNHLFFVVLRMLFFVLTFLRVFFLRLFFFLFSSFWRERRANVSNRVPQRSEARLVSKRCTSAESKRSGFPHRCLMHRSVTATIH